MKNRIKAMIPSSVKYKLKQGLNSYYNMRMLNKYRQISVSVQGDYPMGINLIGDIKAETGLGQSMRILADILEKSQIPFVVIQINQPGDLNRNQGQWDHKIEEKAKYAVNVIHINNSEWAESYIKLPVEILAGRYNIAYWLWELETLPKSWIPCLETVDEIWAPSEFICDCYRRYTDKKIVKIPYGIRLKTPVEFGRSHFELPEDVFLFLIMYDFKSISERKNPKGMVKAFCEAFTPEYANSEKIGLIVKINHVETKQELDALKEWLQEYQYIYYITDNLSRSEVESLIAVADVLVSLHRSEGFGLPLAEAMYLGTPVIATNWSATTEFMTEKAACLVDYQMIELDKQLGPYPKGSRWADADIKQAAEFERKLYEDKTLYDELRREAKKQVGEILNHEKIGLKIKEQIRRIVDENSSTKATLVDK